MVRDIGFGVDGWLFKVCMILNKNFNFLYFSFRIIFILELFVRIYIIY